MEDDDEILAAVSASQGRRIIAYVVQLALGAMLVYVAFSNTGGYAGSIALLVMGILILWTAERLRRSTLTTIYLTAHELRDSTGTVLARIEDVRAISRGVFAFKPSNGFSLVLDRSLGAVWAPGMWWRIGRRVGVGGVTAATAGKFMAERIALLVEARDA